jgi:hypothetical protein
MVGSPNETAGIRGEFCATQRDRVSVASLTVQQLIFLVGFMTLLRELAAPMSTKLETLVKGMLSFAPLKLYVYFFVSVDIV